MATVQCLFACEFAFDPPRYCPTHGHGCVELVYYLGCSGVCRQDGIRLKYRDGDFLVYQPVQTHDDEQKTKGSQICVGVVGCSTDRLPPGLYKANEAVRSAFLRLRAELGNKTPSQAARLDILAGWLSLEVTEQLIRNPVQKPLPRPVDSLKTQLDRRFAEPITLKQLTDKSFIHSDYLRQLFRKEIGQSPMSYLINRRLEAAKELLSSTNMPVFQIAETVGFSSSYYFCRLFKKHTGQTPSDYRGQSAGNFNNIKSGVRVEKGLP